MDSRQALASELAQLCLSKLQAAGDASYLYLHHLPQAMPKYLIWMCNEVIANAAEWPATKSHRWIGYVQGCMVCHGLTTVDDERSAVTQAKQLHSED